MLSWRHGKRKTSDECQQTADRKSCMMIKKIYKESNTKTHTLIEPTYAHPRCWTFCLWRSMRLLCCTDGPRCWAVFPGPPRDTLERTGQSVVSHRSLPFFQPADPQSQVFCFLKKNLNQEQDSDPRVLHWVNPELRLPLPPHVSLLNLAQDLLWNIND